MPHHLNMDISSQGYKTHPSNFVVYQWVDIMQFLWLNELHFLAWQCFEIIRSVVFHIPSTKLLHNED